MLSTLGTYAPWGINVPAPTTVPASHPRNGFLRRCPWHTPSSRSPWKAPWPRLERAPRLLALPHTFRRWDVLWPQREGGAWPGCLSRRWLKAQGARPTLSEGSWGHRLLPGLCPRALRAQARMHTEPCRAERLPQRQRKENPRPTRQLHSLAPPWPRGPPEPRFPGHQSPCDPGAAHLWPAPGTLLGSPSTWHRGGGPPYRQLPTKCLQNAGPAPSFQASRSAPGRGSASVSPKPDVQGSSRCQNHLCQGCGRGEAGAL